MIPSHPIEPINIGLDDENLYLADAYRSPTKGVAVGRIDAKTNVVAGVTNSSPHRLNEAELVRLQVLFFQRLSVHRGAHRWAHLHSCLRCIPSIRNKWSFCAGAGRFMSGLSRATDFR